MSFVAFNSIYRYITTYSSSLSQVPQTSLSSQDSVKIQRPKDQSPPFLAITVQYLNCQGHGLTQEVITLSFVFFYSASYGNKYIFSYTCGLWRKRQESLHCLFACTVTMQAGQNAKDFFLLKVLVLSFQFLQVGKQCQFCRNKLNTGKKRCYLALSL